MYYRNANCAVVVYDITQPVTSFFFKGSSLKASLEKAKIWIEELHKQADPNIVIALAGNKADLESRRAISTEEAREFAEEAGLLFFETSAKSATNVLELFTALGTNLSPSSPWLTSSSSNSPEDAFRTDPRVS